MSVFRVEKTKGYTVMSNHHLRNHAMSLKAKGLLSQMLSLPEDWDYTLQGLAQINKESIDAIREAVRELERAGYIERSRERDERGCLRGTVYTIYEQPHTEPTPEEPTQALPTLDNPTLEKPMLDFPTLENPTQLNTKSTTSTLSVLCRWGPITAFPPPVCSRIGQSPGRRPLRSSHELCSSIWMITPRQICPSLRMRRMFPHGRCRT